MRTPVSRIKSRTNIQTNSTERKWLNDLIKERKWLELRNKCKKGRSEKNQTNKMNFIDNGECSKRCFGNVNFDWKLA